MAKLKLGAILDDKPVKMTIELAATVHRDLSIYAELLGNITGRTTDPVKLVPHMVAKFMAGDREFAKLRKEMPSWQRGSGRQASPHAGHSTGEVSGQDPSSEPTATPLSRSGS
jgi:hypothetical protein